MKTRYIIIAIIAALLAIAGLTVHTEDHVYVNVSGPVTIEMHLTNDLCAERENNVKSL